MIILFTYICTVSLYNEESLILFTLLPPPFPAFPPTLPHLILQASPYVSLKCDLFSLSLKEMKSLPQIKLSYPYIFAISWCIS